MAIQPNISAGTSQQRKDAQITQNFQELANKEKVDVKKDENGVSNILIGYQEGGFGTQDNGIKVAQQGVDVREATDDQLVLSSAFNLFKIVDSGTATITLANPVTHFSDNTATYSHNLGYVPGAIVYVTVDGSLGGELIGTPTTRFDALGNFGFSAWFDVDSTDITLHVQPGGASAYDGTSWDFRFYLVRETASS